jgi:hypothetical protein
MQNNAFLLFKMVPCLKHAGIRGPRPHYCGSPRYLSPAGGLRLPAGKHMVILTYFQTQVNKKMKKDFFYLGFNVLF